MTGRRADGWLPSLQYLPEGGLASGNTTIDGAATGERPARTHPGGCLRRCSLVGHLYGNPAHLPRGRQRSEDPRVWVRLHRVIHGVDRLERRQRVERLAGDALIAADVADLLVIIERDQIERVGRVAVARVDRKEAARRFDRLGMIAMGVIGKGAHQLRPPCPDRIGMLTLDLVEDQGRLLILPALKALESGVVERVDVARDVARVGLGAAAAAERAAGGERKHGRGDGEEGERAGNVAHGGLLSEGSAQGQADLGAQAPSG